MNLNNFITKLLDKKTNGCYVELGSGHPVGGNNTFFLEKEYGWSGLSIDSNAELCEKFNNVRKNNSICADALTFDYRSYFEKNDFPKQIDYLQIDIDEGYDFAGRSVGNPASSLLGLISLPLNIYRFSIITFEHDALINYRYGSVRDAQREILDSLGYSLVQKHEWEDWWVDPKIIPYPKYKNYYFT